jgi:uncharacterized protein (TIGR02246 family)
MNSLALGPHRCVLILSLSTLVLNAMGAQAGDNTQPSDTPAVSAIRAAVQSYVTAYNRGDAKAVAAHWSDSGEWISPSGERFQGRKAIEKELQTLFTENKGVQIEVARPAIRLLSPDVAVEEGTVRVVQRGEPPSDSTYLAIYVKENGEWRLNTVRETEITETRTEDSPLQDLAWLVGKWKDASAEADGAVTIRWTKNKSFLNYSFKVSAPGMDDLEGTQVIGWDPAAGMVRSWMFDSDGGFGQGAWTRKDNTWVVKFTQVMPDGRKATATNIYMLIDPNTFTWKSVGRKVGTESLPNVEEVRMVRVAPGNAAKPTGSKVSVARTSR